jgi:hypothetical protein
MWSGHHLRWLRRGRRTHNLGPSCDATCDEPRLTMQNSFALIAWRRCRSRQRRSHGPCRGIGSRHGSEDLCRSRMTVRGGMPKRPQTPRHPRAGRGGSRYARGASRTPCVAAHAMTSSSEMKISGLLQALANASSGVTQSPCTSLPHIEIYAGLMMTFGGALMGSQERRRGGGERTAGHGVAPRLRGNAIQFRKSALISLLRRM